MLAKLLTIDFGSFQRNIEFSGDHFKLAGDVPLIDFAAFANIRNQGIGDRDKMQGRIGIERLRLFWLLFFGRAIPFFPNPATRIASFFFP